jgi:hypothetical protein
MKSKDVKIYKYVESLNYWGRVVFIVGNKGLRLYKVLKSGTELTFVAWNDNLKYYILSNNSIERKIDKLGMRLNPDAVEEISRWYTVDELVKLVKDFTHSFKFQKEPDDSAWVSIWTCLTTSSRICVSDKNNHWVLEMGPDITNMRKVSICQYDGGNRTKWPFDTVPMSGSIYEPLIPLKYVIKTLQVNYDIICDPLAWKDNKITFKTVTR